MKRLFCLFTLLWCSLLLADNWNLFVYMAADNNLSQNAKQQINEMEAAAQPAGLKIIVQADFPEGAKRYHIQPDSFTNHITSPVLENLGNIDSGYWKTLNEFLTWGRKKYPAQRNMLVIWGHGDSWFKQSDKWIAPDYSYGNAIGVANKDLQKALTDTGHWDILLFDACSMQSVEVLAEIQSFCSFAIGSEDLVPARGFPYGTIIPILNQSPRNIASAIPQLYHQSYLPGGIYNPYTGYLPTTCSSIDTAGFPAFCNSWKGFCRGLREDLDALLAVRKGLYEMNDGMADVDIRQFLLACTDAGFSGAETLLQQWESLVVAASFTHPDALENIGHAAIWFPNSRLTYDSLATRYLGLDFLKTGWLGTLKRAMEDDRGPAMPYLNNIFIRGDKLFAEVLLGRNADSLYYSIDVGSESYFFYPQGYSGRHSFVLAITNPSAYYSLQTYDESGRASPLFTGSLYFYRATPLELSVVPNPSRQGIISRAIWQSGTYPKCDVEVYNLKGQLVFRESLSQAIPDGILDLHSLESFRKLKKAKYLLRIDLGTKSLQAKFSIL